MTLNLEHFILHRFVLLELCLLLGLLDVLWLRLIHNSIIIVCFVILILGYRSLNVDACCGLI